jgi:hypothetical protein
MVGFWHLAGCTSSDVLSDKGFNVGPPVIGGNELEGLGNAGVSGHFMVVKKCDYPPPKSIICHDDKGSAMVPMGTINGGKIMGAGPSFECRLFRVLGMFDALFEVIFKTVPVCNADAGMCFTEVLVWPDSDIFVV